MQIVGGGVILFIAGKKAGGRLAALLLGAFATCSLGIGLAPTPWILFMIAPLFEFLRQLIRWPRVAISRNICPISFEHLPLASRQLYSASVRPDLLPCYV